MLLFCGKQYRTKNKRKTSQEASTVVQIRNDDNGENENIWNKF